MHLLTVWEHERIAVVDARAPGERALTRCEADALMALCERLKPAPMTMGYRSVKFGNHCGVLQAGEVSVEILPKIAGGESFDRGVLLRMIALAYNLPLSRLDAHKVELQSHSLLRALIRWFCDELFTQFHLGLLREYVLLSDDLPAIRGRWRPDVDATRFPGRTDRLSCEFDELTADNRYNRAIKAALRRVQPLARSNERLQRDVALLLGWLQGVEDVAVTAEEVKRLPMHRLAARYGRSLLMAEWLLGSRAPDLRSGASSGFALLFDMSALFQAFLAATLRRALPDGLHLREEGPRHFLTLDGDGQRRFQMKPDLCVLQGDRILSIIDAKWKRLTPELQDGKWGVQQSDVYQLHAYASAYACTHVALWYPGHEQLEEVDLRPEFKFLIEGSSPSGTRLSIDWIELTGLAAEQGWLAMVTKQVESALDRLGLTSAALQRERSEDSSAGLLQS